MENIDKVIIITSSNGPEFEKYWERGKSENTLVKNGRKRGPFKVSGVSQSERHERLKQIINQNGYLVMLHLDNKEKQEWVSFEKNGELFEFFIYYYSTLDESLNGDLWNIDNNYKYTGPDKDPSCPFDKLRMDIISGRDTSSSVKGIIDWVKNKASRTSLLEVQLNTLHQCLTPEGAEKVPEIKNYDLIKNKIVAGNLTVDEFIKEKLVSEKNCFSDNYIQSLSHLRDALLEEETSKIY